MVFGLVIANLLIDLLLGCSYESFDYLNFKVVNVCLLQNIWLLVTFYFHRCFRRFIRDLLVGSTNAVNLDLSSTIYFHETIITSNISIYYCYFMIYPVNQQTI